MKEKNYSRTIASAINSYLKENDWHFSFDEGKGLFEFGLSLENKIKKVSYIINVMEDEYIVYAVSPIGVDADDKETMAAMAEFVCRANYGLNNGNFELDVRDGEVRFKCFVDCEGITPTKDMVQNSIHCPAAMFKRYGAGIVDIIFGNITAKEAVKRCEKANEDEVRSILSELAAGESVGEFGEMLSRLVERLGIYDKDETPDTESVPETIKTDLFGTEGYDD